MIGSRLLVFVLPLYGAAAMSVTLTPSVGSPAPLGTPITFEAAVDDSGGATLNYQFRTRRADRSVARRLIGEGYRVVVDFGPKSSLRWTTIEREGAYDVEVTVRNNSTGEFARDTVRFELTPLAQDTPVVTPTDNPLVFLYSAPACPEGARMRVRFASSDGGAAQQTPAQDCDGRSTMNFYLAGVRAATQYAAWHTIQTEGPTLDGPQTGFTTGALTINPPAAAPLSTPVPDYGGVLLQSIVNGRPIATDLNGNLVWYGPTGLSLITRMVAGGTMLGVFEDGTREPSHQTFLEFDLAGNTIAETNAARVSEQLAALGARPITSFHHEAIRLTDGRYLVLAGSEQIMEDMQGEGASDILGDTILVLDRDLQLLWYWDSFDHMDPARAAVLNETCTYPASLACSTFYGAGKANDWLHGNSLQLTPDGNILYSARHQDWVVKIDYRNGEGNGDVLWRLGRGGDFTLADGDDDSWFSHQHDAQFLPDGVTLVLFDNGNTRINRNGDQGTSRGQVWSIDEASRTATLVLNADLKVNSSALGSVQLLANGNYHFDAGFIPNPANRAQRISQALEVDPSGNIVWGMQITAQQYRSFRLDDLYTPPAP